MESSGPAAGGCSGLDWTASGRWPSVRVAIVRGATAGWGAKEELQRPTTKRHMGLDQTPGFLVDQRMIFKQSLVVGSSLPPSSFSSLFQPPDSSDRTPFTARPAPLRRLLEPPGAPEMPSGLRWLEIAWGKAVWSLANEVPPSCSMGS